MKRVHSTDQLSHLFCNLPNADLEGFKTSTGNMYFKDGVMYSYGSHYPLAVKYPIITGFDPQACIILINSKKSSVTTEKHKWKIRSATKQNQWVYYVPDIENPRDPVNLIHLENEICDSISNVLRGLKYCSVGDVFRAIESYNNYAGAFKLKPFKPLDIEFQTILAKITIDSTARHEKLENERNEKKRIEREHNTRIKAEQDKRTIEHVRKNLILWYTRSIEAPSIYEVGVYARSVGYDLVRIKNAETLITSRGAEVPMRHALFLIDRINKRLPIKGWKAGHFMVESEIDSKGNVIIGCHKINVQQVREALSYHI